jgi:plasmid maintenance system antidote protein VapI
MARKLKDASRSIEWMSNSESISLDEVKAGAILRIADATEVMAQNFVRLQNERDMWQRDSEQRRDVIESLRRQNASLKGVVTKLRRAAAGSQASNSRSTQEEA